MKPLTTYLLGLLTAALAAWMLWEAYPPRITTETITRIDTVPYILPQPVCVDTVPLRTVTARLAVAKPGHTASKPPRFCHTSERPEAAETEAAEAEEEDDTEHPDSVEVEIPITQSRYHSEHYTAWVSGYAATLDSIHIYAPTTTITTPVPSAPRRWGLGLAAGYAVTPAGLQPYVGIALTYTFISF